MIKNQINHQVAHYQILSNIIKYYQICQKIKPNQFLGGAIVAKKWDPGILDPVPFSGQIRKVEARLGKLAKIRKVETD